MRAYVYVWVRVDNNKSFIATPNVVRVCEFALPLRVCVCEGVSVRAVRACMP